MQSLTTDIPSYPQAVLRAYTAVFKHPFFKGLTAKTREVLGEIVIRLDKNNATRPVGFKRESVALVLGCDRKTIFNALKKFEKLGLIVREEQFITPNGFYSCSNISATPQLAELLSLPYPGSTSYEKTYPQETASPTFCSKPARGEKTAFINGAVNNLFKKQPSGVALETETLKTESASKRLWDDPALAFLRSAGVSVFGIFALMKLCKAHGRQRLSVIVDCVKDNLSRLQKDKIFAYLRTCIQAGSDFSAKYAQETAARLAEDDITRRRAFVARFTGKRLIARDGRSIEVADGSCSIYLPSGAYAGESAKIADVFKLFEDGRLAAPVLACENASA